MSDYRFRNGLGDDSDGYDDDLLDDDDAEVISLLPPAVPGAVLPAPVGIEHADLDPLERYQQTANEHLAANEVPRDRLERELGASKAEESAVFEHLVAETTAQSAATAKLARASAEAASPHAAPREIGAALAYGLTAVGGAGLWFVDHNLLLSSFPYVSSVIVNGLAAVAVGGSMVSAHLAGCASKDLDYSSPLDRELKTNRRNKLAASVSGIAIEVVLAVLRAVRTGSVLSSLLLGAAGVALWVFARSLAYRHRSRERINHIRATKEERSTRARATAIRRRWVGIVNAHALTHRRLEERAHGVVDHLSHLAHAAEISWRRLNPDVKFPGLAEPGAARVWRRYTRHWLPEELRLPKRQVPGVEDEATLLAIGPGSDR